MMSSAIGAGKSPITIISLLACVTLRVLALHFDGARPTSAIDNEFKYTGWTPKPTSPPEIFRRVTTSGLPTVCGYTIKDGDPTAIGSCSARSLCTYDSNLHAAGCCRTVAATTGLPVFSSSCYLYTSCLPSSLARSCYYSNSACYSDQRLLWCTYQYYPNCWTYVWQDGPFTSFYCDSGTPTSPYSVFRTPPPICTDPAWQNGPGAWTSSNFDASLSSWWSTASKQTASGMSTANFAHQLSCDFGSNACNVQCGIGSGTACSNPNCADYRVSSPQWSYFARISLTNMNDMLQAIYDGLNLGQLELVGEINTIQQSFFPGQDTSTKFQKSLKWISPIFSALGFIPDTRLAFKAIKAASNMITGGASYLESDPQVLMLLNGEQNLQTVETFIQQTSNATRRALTSWSKIIFSGSQDTSNQTILDYFSGGRFTVPLDIDQNSVADYFYKNIMSQMIGTKWNNTGGTYVLCTNDTTFNFQGQISNSVSVNTSRASSCALFSTQSEVKNDVTQLSNTTFGIAPDEIVASSLGAYAYAKFNFTSATSSQVLEESVSWSADQQPWRQGVSFVGTWTIPVCDMPNSNTQTSGGVTLPCCCAADCSETATFIKVSRLGNFNGKSVCQSAWPSVKYSNSALSSGLNAPSLIISLLAIVISVYI